jgi:hypothetical protein
MTFRVSLEAFFFSTSFTTSDFSRSILTPDNAREGREGREDMLGDEMAGNEIR